MIITIYGWRTNFTVIEYDHTYKQEVKNKTSSFTYAVLQSLDRHDRFQLQKAMQNAQLFFA